MAKRSMQEGNYEKEPENKYVDIKKYPPPNILLGRTVHEWYQLRKIWVKRLKNVLKMNGLKMDIKQIEAQWDGKFDDIIPVLRQRRFFDPEYVSSRSKRNVIPGDEYKWELPIKYDFHEDLSTRNYPGMKWELPIKYDFHEDLSTQSNKCLFAFNNKLISKLLCRRRARLSPKMSLPRLNKRSTGALYVTIIAHEIGHSVGFFHEQSRPGRDAYLLINMSAINVLAASSFHVDEGVDYGSPYDHGSIMHYGPNAFLQKGFVGPVIRTTDSLMQTTIGSGTELSFYDSRSANRFYCSGDCPDNVGDVVLTPSSPTAIINSFNYPNNYSLSSRCNWRIKAVDPNNTSSTPKLIFQFYQTPIFDMVISNKSGSCRHFLEVKYAIDVAGTGPRFCGNTSYPNMIISHTDTLLLGFRSYSQHTNYTALGFKAIITYCDNCTPNATQNISSQFDPEDFTVTYRWAYTEPSFLTMTGSPHETGSTSNVSDSKPACPTQNRNNLTTPIPPIRPPCTRWTDWSLCTEPCGGCGKQVSLRRCLPNIHKSEWIKTRSCKAEPCDVNKTYICHVPKYYPTYDCFCQRTEQCCYGYSAQNNTCQQLEVINPEDIRNKILGKSRIPTRFRINKVRAENVVENDESQQVVSRRRKDKTIFDFILNHIDSTGRIFIN
ncbi:zinc metalloproteinase nas-34-like [Gordionus sp. m RMFG-2023]|uniref:zinc metalloproteinase nas-34-like n=1 Tax=Gordionus sp. m RMFG-2023 TaxID=3053472 RepID=UPI0031FCC0FE